RQFATDSRSRVAAKNNIAAHYDLGNEFFEQMLGPSMTYSCGYMHRPDDSIDTMQQQKYSRIIQKLAPHRGTLLDIGCGWGSLLIYAAQHCPEISGVGVTISAEQQRYAQRRIQEAGLAERIRIELCDYRDLRGTFDRIVSVGMFEHVGKASYPEYMRTFHHLLSPTGVGLLHTIGTEEDPRIPQDPWIAKYIFPGTILPRLEWIVSEARKADLSIGHIENWRPHYATTLHRWRERVVANWDTIRTLGTQYDERFFRLWNYYLQLCEACFIDSTVELYQVLLCRREQWSFPLRFTF
ncbi:MAG: class I SAM-dependent methyltransferase, partial [Proteobacteria bacterium]|nr:class I SAM-dependent methyltransferase [Pseudomonadota bacterium]